MKKISKILSCFLLVFTLTACASEVKPEKKETEIVLKDHLDREVKLEKPVESVVSSYYIATTTLVALGAEDLLSGVEMKAETRAIYQLAAPQLLELPAMGNKKNFNMEECAKINPDLVVLPMSLKDYVPQLENLNIKVIVIDPETNDRFLDTVSMLGKATGHEKDAEQLLAYYEKEQQKMKQALKDVKEHQSVYFASGSDLLNSATQKMYQHEIIMAAKGKAVASDLNEMGWTAISAEQLLAYDPAYIFIENQSDMNADAVMSDVRFASLNAVKNKQVYTFPSTIETWDTPSPSSILGVLWMSSILYPENISMDEVVKEACDFYQQFFDIEVNAEQLGI